MEERWAAAAGPTMDAPQAKCQTLIAACGRRAGKQCLTLKPTVASVRRAILIP